MSERRGFYAELEANKSGLLKVSDLHQVYWEECGNPNGKPAIFVHGGPGGGSSPANRRLWDPEAYRIILFDQRGCGRSTPHAELTDNTTWHLVSDMEAIREHLGIDKWQVFGGSWGSTLALAYAQTHPDRVLELILRGIFMIRRKEIQWFYQEGASRLYPDLFDEFVKPIPEVEREDLVGAFYRRLTSDDRDVRLEAARAWAIWEGSTLTIQPDPVRVNRFAADDFAIAFARIECHYFVHGGWFRNQDQLLEDVDKIRHIPGVIVHGRYDVVTPVMNAWDLHKAWPEADLHIVPDAGHAFNEPGNLHQLISATDRFRP